MLLGWSAGRMPPGAKRRISRSASRNVKRAFAKHGTAAGGTEQAALLRDRRARLLAPELVLEAVHQREPACLDHIVARAHGAPRLVAVRARDEHARARTGAGLA